VIKALVEDGAYSVRVLTRDPSGHRAQALLTLGKPGSVELLKGDGLNEENILKVFEGADLAFVNTDTFTIGEKKEVYWGIRTYELAIRSRIKHYVWGNLESLQQLSGYNPKYRAVHYEAKSRVAQWITSVPKGPNNITSYSFLTSCPYMDMLFESLSPVEQPDGSFVFKAPLGDGTMPLIALDDLAFYARWIFDNPDQSSGLDLQISTQEVTWHEVAATAAKVIGKPCSYEYIPVDQFFLTNSLESTCRYSSCARRTRWYNLRRKFHELVEHLQRWSHQEAL